MNAARRAVLITGGSRGIGLASAGRFLADGACVTIAGRSEAALADAAAQLEGDGRVRTVVADVSTVAGCRAAVAGALDAFGRLDVLFTKCRQL
jgi:NAD(P)-dependent dehydrogenase (short-subunit alcohol dehydrogenase family)